jgi:solute carrier family 50 (sugar transporter)
VGVVLSSFQYSSSIKITLEARRLRNIGTINPKPLAVSFLVCLLYLIYGCMLRNTYYVLSIFCGLPVCLFACTTSLTLLGHHNRHNAAAEIERILIFSFMGLAVIGLLFCAGLFSFLFALRIIGILCMISVLVYYLAPLSGIVSMIRQQDASSLYYPTMIISVMASFVWTAYGVSYGDPNLFVPSFIGLMLSLVQISVKTYYTRRQWSRKASLDSEHTQNRDPVVLNHDLGDGGARSRKISFDGGPVVTYADLAATTLQFSTTEETEQSITREINGENHRERSNTLLTTRSRANTATSVMTAMTAADVVLDALSGLLAPFNPTLTADEIIAAEKAPSLVHLPFRDEPVTILGVFADLVSGIPAVLDGTVGSYHDSSTTTYEAQQLPDYESLGSEVRSTVNTYGVSGSTFSTILEADEEDVPFYGT